MGTVLGLDWGGRGWIGVSIDEDGTETDEPLECTAAFYPSMLNVWRTHRDDCETILVDIPIGLPTGADESSNATEPITRACDDAAKTVLGSDRRASVFDVPCREAATAETFDVANETNREKANRGLTVQAWSIVPRILEVEALLCEFEDARPVVREAHPEVCFAKLGGGDGVVGSKLSADGRKRRLEVLASLGDRDGYEWARGLDDRYRTLERECIDDFDPHERRIHASNRDDLLDAFVLAATAYAGDLRRLPDEDEFEDVPTDDRGHPMEIVYHEPDA